ncbi:MAG: rod shape-determining protein MreC [Bacillota bacterium]
MDFFEDIKIKFIVLLLVILISVLFINILDLDFYIFTWLENGIYNILSPFFNILDFTGNYLNGIYQSFFQSQELLQENQKLREELSEQIIINISLNEVVKENKRMRNIYNLDSAFIEELDLLGTRVTGQAPSSWEQRIMINQGSNQGVKKRLPVISFDGFLVGKIISTGVNSSQVMMANDPDFSVGGRVSRESSRASGVVRGQPGETGQLIMERINWDADIKKGDLIITSGISGQYPRGLPIGKVKEVFTDNFGLSQSAYIDYSLGNQNLEELLIILEF